ncbi:MAG TPA: Ig-like domain-containing protein [Steroidobacteraceae bacterium]|nr:Ig-like domain-containing protein [Steroidobacteraceae bacterium]
MFPPRFRNTLLTLCALVILAGCGGGGSDGPPRPPPNVAPVLTSTAFAATEDTPFAGQLTATDAENQAITFARVTDAQHGQASISAAGAVAYTPVANYSGADTFSVRVTDSAGGASTGTVTINVAGVNDVPVFTLQALNTNEDVALNSALSSHVVDPDPTNTFTFTVTAAPAHGALTVSASGAAVFTPVANYNGTDSFAVSISDGAGGTVSGTVTINILAVNDAPVLTTNQLSVSEDGVLSTQLVSADVENQVVVYQLGNGSGSGASHGQASISATGLLTYTPDANFNGAETLMVGLADSATTLTLQPLAITVVPVNDPPSASEDLLRIPATGAVLTLPVLANDTDVDGDTLAITILSQPGGGTLSVNASNELRFTRDNQFNGPLRFRYRITDAAGVTAEADVRAVIGDFSGIYYLTDETTVGQLELHWFDGLRVHRLGTDLEAGEEISSFAMSGDGQTVAYVVENATVSRVFITGPNASDSRLIFTSGLKPPGSPVHPTIKLNRNGNYLLVADPFANGGYASYMVRTTDGLSTRVGGSTPDISLVLELAFNPVNDDFYVSAEVGASPGNGYRTLFRGHSGLASTLTRVGAVYPPGGSSGESGVNIAITSDGRYTLHEEIIYSPSLQSSVLVYDTVGNAEAPVYRRPDSGQVGMWNGFALSNDGSRVCFMFRQPGFGTFGPSTIVAGSPGAPALAAPVTPVFENIDRCRFVSDNRTILYNAMATATSSEAIYAVDASAPTTPVVVNRPNLPGEHFERWWVARTAPRLAFATRKAAGETEFYSVSLDAPGTFITFGPNLVDDGSMPGQLDRNGFVLAYSKRLPATPNLRRLTLLSTQSANYSLPLTRADSTTGLVQFEWAP